MSEHSKLSPSSAKRWLTCNPSINAPEGKSSIYSAEGTCAHTLIEDFLLLGLDPALMKGKTLEVDGFKILVTEEMVRCVTEYCDYIHFLSLMYGEYRSEQRVIHSEIEDFGGTIDCCFPGEQVVIVDYKHGAGVFVDVEQNEQLGCYALLILDSLKRPIQDVIAIVVQPRCPDGEPIRETVLTKSWLENLRLQISMVIDQPSDQLHAGPHCRFCPLKVTCSAVSSMSLSVAKEELGTALSEGESGDALALVKSVLDKSATIRDYLKSCEEWALAYVSGGGTIPGYKLVQSISNRKYKFDEAKILRICAKHGFKKKQCCTPPELLSPAQLEKVVGATIVNPLCHREMTGLKLVEDSDKREAVKRLTAKDDFSGIGDVE